MPLASGAFAAPPSLSAQAGAAGPAGSSAVVAKIAPGKATSGAVVQAKSAAASAIALTSDPADPPALAGAGSGSAQDGGGADGGSGSSDGSEADSPAASPGAPAPAAAQPTFALPPPVPGVTASPATVQSLAAEMVRRLDQRVSRFEVALNPAGLGHVTVSLQINARGGLSATLACHQPHAAAELQARADDLRQSLQSAGFDVPSGALSFSSSGGAHQGQGGGASGFTPVPSRFASTRADADPDAAPLAWSRPARGLDIHV